MAVMNSWTYGDIQTCECSYLDQLAADCNWILEAGQSGGCGGTTTRSTTYTRQQLSCLFSEFVLFHFITCSHTFTHLHLWIRVSCPHYALVSTIFRSPCVWCLLSARQITLSLLCLSVTPLSHILSHILSHMLSSLFVDAKRVTLPKASAVSRSSIMAVDCHWSFPCVLLVCCC